MRDRDANPRLMVLILAHPAQKIGLQWMSELNYSPPQLKKEDSLKTIRQEMSTEISVVARN